MSSENYKFKTAAIEEWKFKTEVVYDVVPDNALLNDDGSPILNDDGSYILTN